MPVLPHSALSRSTRRVAGTVGIAALGAAIALGTTACGAGQISQTANQLPAVNGNSANLKMLALRDVLIVYPTENSDQTFKNGGPFSVSFVISNQDVQSDRLVSIKPAQGTVNFSGSTEIPGGKALRAGKPANLLVASGTPEDPSDKRISVTLTGTGSTVRPGLTTPLTFTFQNSGSVTVQTPVDTGALEVRKDKVREAEAPADEHAGGH